MSWTRRLLVLLAFALMLAGVGLMISEKEELFLGLSIAGFALVLAAVPSLPKEAADEELGGGRSPAAGGRERLPEEPPSGAVTVVPNVPVDQQTLERPAEDAEAPPAAGPAKAVTGPPEPALGAREAPEAAAHREEPPREEEEPDAEAKELARLREEPVPAPAAEPVPEPPPPSSPGGAASSTRKLAIGATAAGATVLLWRWLRR